MNIKKKLLLLFTVLLPLLTKAQIVVKSKDTINSGVHYKIYYLVGEDLFEGVLSKVLFAEVIPPKDGYYSGGVIIQDSVKFEWNYEGGGGKIYNVPVYCVGDKAFLNCQNLMSITIPRTIKYICPSAFEGCINLTTVSFTENNEDYKWENNCLINKGTIIFGNKNSVIPNNITSIGGGYYNYNEKINGATWDEYINYHGWYGAFKNCSDLESVVIPESINSIGMDAFVGCRSLKEVTCYNPTPPYMFDNNPNIEPVESPAIFDEAIGTATLYVPDSAIDKYKGAAPWSGFLNIVAIPDSPTTLVTNLANSVQKGEYYNLRGERVGSQTRGIVIWDKKKYVNN